MPKFSDLNGKEKAFKTACIGSGFIMGVAVGGTLCDAMKRGGCGDILSTATGLAVTSVYTTVFKVCADTMIVANRENKLKEAKQLMDATELRERLDAREDSKDKPKED